MRTVSFVRSGAVEGVVGGQQQVDPAEYAFELLP